ncbi:hypothetical protein F511_29976 [Dorcoceras hygrometricum]|uniref:Uncharacterized protein n=1 Tax=Dorcoceras hygrometricum TaxID=472368 RepID=A0A2Z7BY46_9LAMI|nr:hypothetical protein F511_29976 [Dorcoceras hygrometricum]
MAMSILPFLLLLAAAVTAARPCKTIFYLSATSYYPLGNPIPNSLFHNPRHVTLIFTTTTTLASQQTDHLSATSFDPVNPSDFESDSDSEPSNLPIKFYSSVSNSIRQRSRDIMSVAGALLFGVACGALTAATIYFVWALFSPARFDFDDISSSDDDDEDDDDDVTDSKTFGYVAIPTKLVDDDTKKPVPLAKEVV